MGELPFVAATPMLLMQSIVTSPTPALPHGLFSQPFVDFVSRCLEKTPDFRPGYDSILVICLKNYRHEKLLMFSALLHLSRLLKS